MSETRNNGGDPVYPCLTLRDYFAAHAPKVPNWFASRAQMDAMPEGHFNYTLGDDEIFFAWRWYYADAMLKSRGE